MNTVQKIVVHTLKILQHLLYDFQNVYHHFVDVIGLI